MPSPIIQWFPGHMAKAGRLIRENLTSVDIVFEILDARIPESSKNPDIAKILGDKPVLSLFTKTSLADPRVNDAWKAFYKKNGAECLFIDSVTGDGIGKISEKVNAMLSEKIERYARKGIASRTLKAMVVGIPNVGKSALINRLCGAKKAKVENRPGVTLTKQWVKTTIGIDLLDMPGVLWPKFEDERVGENLAMTGAIKDTILDTQSLAVKLCAKLRIAYPRLLCDRYNLGDPSGLEAFEDREIFELIGKKRGFLVSGGEIDYARTAKTLLDEFRDAKIGRISLEAPK